MAKNEQQDITPEAASDTPKAEAKKTAPKEKPEQKPLQLISFSEYKENAKRDDITFVLEQGFRVWMKTAKQEPLRSRTFGDWEKLIEEYLKS